MTSLLIRGSRGWNGVRKRCYGVQSLTSFLHIPIIPHQTARTRGGWNSTLIWSFLSGTPIGISTCSQVVFGVTEQVQEFMNWVPNW